MLGTERHEARRIDNQLRGGQEARRSRIIQVHLSLEDELMRLFGGDMIGTMMEK